MKAFGHETTSPGHPRGTAVALAIIIAISIPAAALVASSSASVSLNDIQVSIQTTQALPYQYTLAAYNSSGDQVANFYGNYPQASFGLPLGAYLITASAYYQQSYGCGLCPLAAGANGTATPIGYQPPSSEYGYAVVKVTGPAQITITTKNSSALPLVSLPVHVSFFNGTAASDAYVSAYVVGGGYAYSPKMVSYGQTGSDGNFTLVMPDAPVQVNAYLSAPIQLPKNETRVVPVEVGGQKVNVTEYWQPDYISLSGQALILPPQKGADITLKFQQYPNPIYYSTPPAQAGVSTVTTYTTTAPNGTSGQPASSGQANEISPFDPSNSQLSPGRPASALPGYSSMMLAGVLAGVVGAAALVAGVVLGRKKSTTPSARP